jgi:uncharacterized protein
MASISNPDSLAVSDDQPTAPLPRPWGFWVTLAWLAGACIIGELATRAVYFAWRQMTLSPATPLIHELAHQAFDLGIVIVLVAASGTTHLTIRRYLALVWPRRRDVLIGLACIAGLFIADQVATHIFGLGIEDYRNDLSSYRDASINGTLPLLWFSWLVVGPIGEEIAFRGFLYQGWSQSRLGTIGTILLMSVLFALMHWTYTWISIFAVFYFALLVGWMRWRSESLFVPMLLHFVYNLLFVIEVAIDVHRS